MRLEHRLRGRPPDLDSNVQDYIRKLRLACGVVNRFIIIAAARGIVAIHPCCVSMGEQSN